MNTETSQTTDSAQKLGVATGSAPSNAAIAEIAAIAGRLSLFGAEENGQKILNALEVLALRIEHLESRKKWWIDNATELGKERGELFRAGENMAAELCQWCPHEMRGEVLRAWDAAAQPVRDMVASLTPASLQNAPDQVSGANNQKPI